MFTSECLHSLRHTCATLILHDIAQHKFVINVLPINILVCSCILGFDIPSDWYIHDRQQILCRISSWHMSWFSKGITLTLIREQGGAVAWSSLRRIKFKLRQAWLECMNFLPDSRSRCDLSVLGTLCSNWHANGISEVSIVFPSFLFIFWRSQGNYFDANVFLMMSYMS